ncbi:MAG: hypothetical protein SangKO_046070 [Sandaracinaceae bacterium]
MAGRPSSAPIVLPDAPARAVSDVGARPQPAISPAESAAESTAESAARTQRDRTRRDYSVCVETLRFRSTMRNESFSTVV